MTIKTSIKCALAALTIVSCAQAPKQAPEESMEDLTARVFAVAEQDLIAMDSILTDSTMPRTYSNDGKFVSSDIYWWCSGFYPGSLWYAYEYTGNEKLKELAIKHTEKLEPVQFVTDNHDVGFMLYCSYGNGLRLTGNEKYKEILAQGAKSLITRYRPNAGVIQSWECWKPTWHCPVIIDNMMNLELLMFAEKECGLDTCGVIARTHADTTIKNHFREDYTTYHVVDYIPETGEVFKQQTQQGYADESAWGRGQAWGHYGYTMMYRMTGDEKYLAQAEAISDMLLSRLAEDGVSQWDFDAPNAMEYRDASAAAIEASAFVELSTLTKDAAKKEAYLAQAEKILRRLASPDYLAEPGTNGNFILKHSVGSLPQDSEVDVPLTYADYYFLEALLRYREVAK